jgi:hypothetical protein
MPKRWLTIEHCSQEVDAGCLAACVQMALAHLDITVSQKALKMTQPFLLPPNR